MQRRIVFNFFTNLYLRNNVAAVKRNMLAVSTPDNKTALIHVRARRNHPAYQQCNVDKFPVPDDRCLWSVAFDNYAPTEFTSKRILEQPPYADPKDPREVDWSARRFSLEYARQGQSEMKFDSRDRPLNPIGRTGMTGRGRLVMCNGIHRPNQAADMLVSRKTSDVVEFVVIQRSDTGIWAMPGGMVDGAKESFQHAAVREFFEEAAASLDESSAVFQQLLRESTLCYSGYVDDNRATDNAWTETQLYHFDATQLPPSAIPLKFSDDAVGVKWMRADDPIFANPDTFHGHHHDMIIDALKLNMPYTNVSLSPKSTIS